MKIKRRTIVVLALWLRIVGCVFFVGSILYLYFGTQMFTTTTFSFIGIDKEDTQKIEQALAIELTKEQVWFFPSNKVLTAPSKHIIKDIKELLPNTDFVKVYPSGFHTLTIEVVPYTPLFRLSSGRAIDPRGIVYKEQHDISILPMISFATGTPAASFLANISTFITKVNTMMFPVRYIVINDIEDVYMSEKASSSMLIIKADVDFKKAWSTLVSALDTDPLKTMMQKDKGNLEYIDLRFGNKVFYKFTNAVPVSIISSHNATSTATSTVR